MWGLNSSRKYRPPEIELSWRSAWAASERSVVVWRWNSESHLSTPLSCLSTAPCLYSVSRADHIHPPPLNTQRTEARRQRLHSGRVGAGVAYRPLPCICQILGCISPPATLNSWWNACVPQLLRLNICQQMPTLWYIWGKFRTHCTENKQFHCTCNLLTPELYPSTQHCLPRFNGDLNF
jgi:hypothetical protein